MLKRLVSLVCICILCYLGSVKLLSRSPDTRQRVTSQVLATLLGFMPGPILDLHLEILNLEGFDAALGLATSSTANDVERSNRLWSRNTFQGFNVMR